MTDSRTSVPSSRDWDRLVGELAEAGRDGRPLPQHLRSADAATQASFRDIVAMLEEGPPPMPPASQPPGEVGWLERIERLALAERALRDVEALRWVHRPLLRFLESAQRMLRRAADPWRYGRRAEASGDWLPWSELRARIDAEPFPERPEEVVRAWMDGALATEHDRRVNERVRTDARWQSAYRALVAQEAAVVEMTQYHPAWSLDIAREEGDLASARTLLSVPLPHAGGILEVRQHAEGTVWDLPWGTDGVRVPHGREAFRWGDEVLGNLSTRIEADAPSDRGDFEHGVRCLMEALREERRDGRVEEAARAIVAAYRGGPLVEALTEAARTFEAGDDPDDETTAWVAAALQGRLVLEEAAAVVSDDTILDELVAADDALAPHADAVLLLSDEAYENIVGELELDEEAWWGVRVALRREVPDSVLDTAFSELRAKVKPAKWLSTRPDASRAGYAVAAAPKEERPAAAVGRVVVPVVVVGRAESMPIHVRVACRTGPGGIFGEERLGQVAKAAVVEAYHAAASLAPSGCPPHALEDHAVDILDDAGMPIERIDGDSLGLAMVLAFLSAWLEQPLPADLVVTGRIAREGGAYMVKGVGWVEEKLEGIRRTLRSRVRVLIPEEDRPDGVRDLRMVPVARLSEAVRESGLDPSAIQGAPSVHARRVELERLARVVESQDLSSCAQAAELAGLEAWHLVAERMRRLIESLEGEGVVDDTYRAWAVLAFTHAGRFEEAWHLLPTSLSDRADVRALQLLVQVGTLIDAERWEECRRTEASLEAALADLPAGAHDVRGKALGALGRAALHRRELERALTMLEGAVCQHLEHLPAEAPRSRIYLASALRMAGRYGDAVRQLDKAKAELVAHALPWFGRPYHDVTLVYWHYGRARLHVAMDQPDTALGHVDAGLRLLPSSAVWPRVGLLRTAAWARRLAGEHELADSLAREIRALAAAFPMQALVERLAEEAERMPHDGGVVY
ncbi:MAG: S16 family serine protease [Myxococcota bacterium]